MKAETRASLLEILTHHPEGLTTAAIAQGIDLSRSATSLYLNELLQNGEVKQTGTKPVIWLPLTSAETSNSENVFEAFIGSQGSAREAIKKCVAAVMYPPLGLPLLIHGPSGVGKSFLARLIFDYLKQNKAKGAEKFFVFNCADYANNPELLSSMLFGHAKGAFTGADQERKGLLAQADQGVLFLDEVHRLSKENQEKLFQFMDSGTFRTMGEDEKVQHSQVRLLFATTEKPEEVLLPTFYRRISVMIDLPSFHDRPIYERYELIKFLFLKEAQRIKRKLVISQTLMDQLSQRNYPGNVGSLANAIRMYCAAALQKNPSAEMIAISFNGEPPTLTIDYQTEAVQHNFFDADALAGLHQLFRKDQSITDLKQELKRYHQATIMKFTQLGSTPLADKINETVQKKNAAALGNLQLTEEPMRYVCDFLDYSQNQLAQSIWTNLRFRLLRETPRTYHLAQLLTADLPGELIPAAKGLLAVFLAGRVNEDIRYHALLVAHGESTATSIQGVANKLNGEYLFDAINMPLSSSVQDIVAKVKNWLSERETSDGVIMLVDMGSLTQLYKNLKPQILGELLVINNLTTSFALEIGNQLLNGSQFHAIAKTAEKQFKTEIQYFEGFSVEKNIIISSISGRDVSKKLKAICHQYVNPDIKLIVLNYNEMTEAIERATDETEYLKSTSLILTTSYLDTEAKVKTLNLLDVLDDNAEEKLEQAFYHLVHPNNIQPMLNEFIHFFSKEGLSEKLEFLNPDVIIRQVEEATEKCERRFNLQLNAKMKFNLTMHLALMVERTILGGADYPVPEDINALNLNDKPFYTNIKTILYNLEQFYRTNLSDWELYVLYEILNS